MNLKSGESSTQVLIIRPRISDMVFIVFLRLAHKKLCHYVLFLFMYHWKMLLVRPHP